MADVIFNSAKKDLFIGAIDLDTDTFKMMLVTSSYTPDQDAHAHRSDVTNEVTGAGYTAGGATLTGVSVTQDNALNLAKFTANPVVWSTATITARAGVIYKSRGGAASADELLCYLDFGSDKTSTSGDFTITPAAAGILTAA